MEKPLRRIKIVLINLFTQVIVFFSVISLAIPPESKFIEIDSSFVNGRSASQFRVGVDNNVVTTLSQGTQGKILQRKIFKSGNSGLEVKVLSGPFKDKTYWIYYNEKKPALHLYENLEDLKTGRSLLPHSKAKAKYSVHRYPTRAYDVKLYNELKKYKKEKEIDEPNLDEDEELAQNQPSDLTSNKLTPDNEENFSDLEDNLGFQNYSDSLGSSFEALHNFNTLNLKPKIKDCTQCTSIVRQDDEKYLKPMVCTKQNDYLEKQLVSKTQQGSPTEQYLLSSNSSDLDFNGVMPKCVRQSLRQFPKGYAKKCGPDKRPKPTAKACVTENLVNLSARSFNLAALCLKPIMQDQTISQNSRDEDYKRKLEYLFKMINRESGFHPNSANKYYAGVGQFGNGTVDEINKTEMPRIQSLLSKSSDPRCRQVYTDFFKDSDPIEKGSLCERMDLTNGSSIKNMFYTFIYFSMNQEDLERSVFRSPVFKNRMALSTTELSKLKDAIVTYAHNIGPGSLNRSNGVSGMLSKVLLTKFSASHPATRADQIIDLLNNGRNTYLDHIEQSYNPIKDTLFLSEGLCIHGQI